MRATFSPEPSGSPTTQSSFTSSGSRYASSTSSG
jgi:hypothetical protein